LQVKLFSRSLSELAGLEAEVNQWLAANPKLIAIQRDRPRQPPMMEQLRM
jgi:hypothetical protein